MFRIWRRRSSCVHKQWPWLQEKALAGRSLFTQEAKDKRVQFRYIIKDPFTALLLTPNGSKVKLSHLYLALPLLFTAFARPAYHLFCLLFSYCQGSASKHCSTFSRTQFTCTYLSDSVKRPRENEVITATPSKRIRWSVCLLLGWFFFLEKIKLRTIIEDRLCKW